MTETNDKRPEDRSSTSVDNLHYVIDANELDPGKRVLVDVEGREVAVFNIDGEYHAIANYCVHQGGPVGEGSVSGTTTAKMSEDDWELCYECDNEIVSCPWHGWQFDIETGQHLAHSKFQLPTYPVTVRDGKVYLDI